MGCRERREGRVGEDGVDRGRGAAMLCYAMPRHVMFVMPFHAMPSRPCTHARTGAFVRGGRAPRGARPGRTPTAAAATWGLAPAKPNRGGRLCMWWARLIRCLGQHTHTPQTWHWHRRHTKTRARTYLEVALDGAQPLQVLPRRRPWWWRAVRPSGQVRSVTREVGRSGGRSVTGCTHARTHR